MDDAAVVRMRGGDTIRMVVVFRDHPGHPGMFALIEVEVRRDGKIVHGSHVTCFPFESDEAAALERAREWCRARGFSSIDRTPSDDPTVCETWL